MTPEEERDALDSRLQVALAEFDDMLLEQQQDLEEKQRADPLPSRGAEAATGGSGGSGSQAAAGGGAGQSAGQQGRGERAGTQGGDQTGASSTGGSRDEGGAAGGSASTGGVEGDRADGDPRVPKDVGDGHDDDVVARQLREAAMKEDDPELREKLWDEYREYKRSTGS
jgi:hypothetical protein